MSWIGGQVAIVTGGAQGLGEAYAAALRARGATVVTCDVQPGADAIVDVSVPGEVRRFVDRVAIENGPIGILVNNAAVCRTTNPLDAWDKALDDLDAHVATNLRGVYLMGRAVLPSMVEAGGGHVVNIGTDHTCRPPELPWVSGNFDIYDATKWALVGLTRSWANAMAPRGIRANVLSMGATDTPMLRRSVEANTGAPPSDEVVATWMRPDDVASVLVELLEEGPGGRTGENIPLIAGRPVVLPPRHRPTQDVT